MTSGCLSWALVALASAAAGGDGPATTGEVAWALAGRVDARIAERWEAAKVVPAAEADDAEFLRRVSLDVAGRIPTAAEVRAFLDDRGPWKRRRVVDRLLDSPGYVEHQVDLLAHLLIPEADTDHRIAPLVADFRPWLRRSVASNVGFDAMTREILTTAVGREPVADRIADARPTPSGYYATKQGRPDQLAAATARTFLGLRLECAKCHDHPYARWTRNDFWGFAAFFGGIEADDPGDCRPSTIRERPDRREIRVSNGDRVVRAAYLGDAARPRVDGESGRAALARWVVDPVNPYFARATVNRVWAQFLGVGFVDPVDDLGVENPPSHPAAMDDLARSFVDSGHDLRFLIRAITSTRSYNLTSGGGAPGRDDPRLFARMPVRNLTAEQILDSLAVATGVGVRPPAAGPTDGDAGGARARFLEAFRADGAGPTEPDASILRALTLMNGEIVSEAIAPGPGRTLSAVADDPTLDPAGAVEALYLATLSRRPTRSEAARLVAHVAGAADGAARTRALADVLWALLNCGEFLLNH